MTDTIELWRKSACDLAERVARGDVSAVQVIEAHLARMAAVNPWTNAVVHVLADEARAAAVEADRQRAHGSRLGPLHGVPFTVKANIDVAGLATTCGVPALSAAIAPQDAPVVERMRAAGAILIGRTNMPDLALRMHTDSTLYGLTRNPWHPDRTAGGSSGGDAAALATGMTPIGLGNDMGGSLRNPATACGIASIRPSAGRVPHAPSVPAPDRLISVQAMFVNGPLARRVADLKLVLGILAGAHPRDPWSISAPFSGPPPEQPIKVAVLPAPPGGETDPKVAEVVRRAADALSDAGYGVEEACPPRYEDALRLWGRLGVGDFESAWQRVLPLLGPDGVKVVEGWRRRFAGFDSASSMSRALMERDGIARAWSMFLHEHPLLLSPTWAGLPFENGFDVATDDSPSSVLDLVRPVLPANLLGLPAVSVPAGRDPETGLPIGVMLTAGLFRDDLCLDAAAVIERWHGTPTPIDPLVQPGTARST